MKVLGVNSRSKVRVSPAVRVETEKVIVSSLALTVQRLLLVVP